MATDCIPVSGSVPTTRAREAVSLVLALFDEGHGEVRPSARGANGRVTACAVAGLGLPPSIRIPLDDIIHTMAQTPIAIGLDRCMAAAGRVGRALVSANDLACAIQWHEGLLAFALQRDRAVATAHGYLALAGLYRTAGRLDASAVAAFKAFAAARRGALPLVQHAAATTAASVAFDACRDRPLSVVTLDVVEGAIAVTHELGIRQTLWHLLAIRGDAAACASSGRSLALALACYTTALGQADSPHAQAAVLTRIAASLTPADADRGIEVQRRLEIVTVLADRLPADHERDGSLRLSSRVFADGRTRPAKVFEGVNVTDEVLAHRLGVFSVDLNVVVADPLDRLDAWLRGVRCHGDAHEGFADFRVPTGRASRDHGPGAISAGRATAI